jgi:GMP synthase (glutamine-hydrolysing)
LKEGFFIIISGVYAYPFDASWLGAELTEERIKMLEKLEMKYRINPSGEGGELETFVLDAPIFQKRIEILKASKSYANYRGQFVIEEMRLVDKPAGLTRPKSPEIGREKPGDEDNDSKNVVRNGRCILLVDLCFEKDSLSLYEFVHPIRDTLQEAGFFCGILHYTEVTSQALAGCDKIILCGTALLDNEYAKHLELFSWIKELKKPILGICAGMQVIGAVYGGSIVHSPAIGLEEIEIVRASPLLGEPRRIEGYQLHNYAAALPHELSLLAGSADAVQAFQHAVHPTYGIIFHPEVRNRWILERFANL